MSLKDEVKRIKTIRGRKTDLDFDPEVNDPFNKSFEENRSKDSGRATRSEAGMLNEELSANNGKITPHG